MAKVLLVAAAVFTLAFLPAAHGASGRTIVVGDCPNADTTSIQAGVTMAAAGDLVLVCAGTYAESVTIDAAHSDIAVKAKGPHGGVVLAGSGPPSPMASD